MYVVAGATGRVGSVVASTLLDAGHEVRVLVRRPQDAQRWVEHGAQARMAALEDQTALTEALEGCTGMFTLLPFSSGTDDPRGHAAELVASISGAVHQSEVSHVVMLSSLGAELLEGTGPITGLHLLEQGLRATGTTLTALRSGHFQDKVADVIPAARDSGTYPVFSCSAERRMPMVATSELGRIAADVLQDPPTAGECVDVLGPAYTEREIATALGDALGKNLEVIELPAEHWVDALMQVGFGPRTAKMLSELYSADDAGRFEPVGDRLIETTTPIDDTIERILSADRKGAA